MISILIFIKINVFSFILLYISCFRTAGLEEYVAAKPAMDYIIMKNRENYTNIVSQHSFPAGYFKIQEGPAGYSQKTCIKI